MAKIRYLKVQILRWHFICLFIFISTSKIHICKFRKICEATMQALAVSSEELIIYIYLLVKHKVQVNRFTLANL